MRDEKVSDGEVPNPPKISNGNGSSPTRVPDGYELDKTHPNEELVGFDVTNTLSKDPVPAEPLG